MRTLTHAEWKAEAISHYGQVPLDWAFRCPVCKHVATVREYKEAGAPQGAVAFSCIGRWKGMLRDGFRGDGPGPCNYTGGGLFRLNPVKVVYPDGTDMMAFEFGAVPEEEKEPKTT